MRPVRGCRGPRHLASRLGPRPAPTLGDRPLGSRLGSARSREASGSRLQAPRPDCTSSGCCPSKAAEQRDPREATEWAPSSLATLSQEHGWAPEEASCAWRALVPLKSPLSQQAAGGIPGRGQPRAAGTQPGSCPLLSASGRAPRGGCVWPCC